MKLVQYKPPNWFLNHQLIVKNFDSLKSKLPKYRFNFMSGKRPTPIQNFDINQFNDKTRAFEFFIKRDDLTHEELNLQGNKIRKCEFLFAEAITHKAKHILTAGGLQSNHARTVSSLCAKLDLKPHLFLRSQKNNLNDLRMSGNLLINFFLDANIYLVESSAKYSGNIDYKMQLLQNKIMKKYNETAYIIPIGGSNTIVKIYFQIKMNI